MAIGGKLLVLLWLEGLSFTLATGALASSGFIDMKLILKMAAMIRGTPIMNGFGLVDFLDGTVFLEVTVFLGAADLVVLPVLVLFFFALVANFTSKRNLITK